jgi:hypothetical protein
MNILKLSRAPTNPSEGTKVPAGIWLAIPGLDLPSGLVPSCFPTNSHEFSKVKKSKAVHAVHAMEAHGGEEV